MGVDFYLSSPRNAVQAHLAGDMPVLISFGCFSPWQERYMPSFRRVLIDSGAFSELNSGKAIDPDAYAEFSRRMLEHPNVDAAACLDDIRGDWEKGLANWEAAPWTFPVFHDSDPGEALTEILQRLEGDPGRPRWIGLGMKPPRRSEGWLKQSLRRIELAGLDLHVHCFAMGKFAQRVAQYRGTASIDSTNWVLDVAKLLDSPLTRHLTPAECQEIIVKRYARRPSIKIENERQTEMFE